jgi:two-component system sensor histidine kinase HupT/HoxJ
MKVRASERAEQDAVIGSFVDQLAVNIASIRDILRSGAGFLPGVVRQVFVRDLVEKAVRIAASTSTASVRIEARLPETVSVQSDPGHILIALLELLTNAFEAAGSAGRVHVLVAARRTDTDDDVVIGITNSGDHIQDPSCVDVFDPRFTSRGEGHGTGLGVARRSAEAVGGQVGLVHSDVDGTTFELALPRVSRLDAA